MAYKPRVLIAAEGGTGLTSPGSSGNVLTSNGSAWVSSAPTGGSGVTVTRFTASGTWTKGASTKWVRIIGWSGGSGGGSGRRGAAGSDRGGGSGGVTNGVFDYSADASLFGATETVTIGSGGNGGSAQTADDSNGNNGSDGGVSAVGNVTSVGFFPRGEGGTTGNANGGAQCRLFTQDSYKLQLVASGQGVGGQGRVAAGGAGTDYPSSNADASCYLGCFTGGVGGGGGGISSANTSSDGGRGGNLINANGGATVLAGGAGGTAGGTVNGSNGNAGGTSITSGGYTSGGTGGGGGAGGGAGVGGTGGDGAIPGGSGGGGGASVNGQNSGAGGNGARGEVWIFEW